MPDLTPPGHEPDPRPDIQQAVEARADALARGKGGSDDGALAATGDFSGNAGTGGEVKNQNGDAQ